MKKTIDLVRKGMELKKLQSDKKIKKDTKALRYNLGQIQIVDYILENKGLPEDLESHLTDMYNASILQVHEFDPNQADAELLFMEVIGASDILAWILDISENQHEQNKS